MISAKTTESQHGSKRQKVLAENCIHDVPLVISLSIHDCLVRRILVDTGSSANIIFYETFLKMGIPESDIKLQKVPLIGFSGAATYSVGSITLPISWGKEPSTITKKAEFLIVDSPSAYNVILGRPGLNLMKAQIKTFENELIIPMPHMPYVIKGDIQAAQTCFLTTLKEVEEVKEKKLPAHTCETMEETEAERLEPASDLEEFHIDVAHPDRTILIGKALPIRLKHELLDLLARNKDIFAWTTIELGKVPRSFAEHRLGVPEDSKPIIQKRRFFAPAKQEVIKTEINELLKAQVIRRVEFPSWVSNPVVVPKPDGSWRVCIDFTSLNKAIPKRPFPMPRIDQLVDATSEHSLLCFLDAHKGYHQIQMAKGDEDKTSFITPQGLFCYTRMPFGLKNAGAEFQDLVNRMFTGQLGKTIEAYVDDILVKSRTSEQIIPNLQEAFTVMRKHGLKLNPKKCSFGVEAGKFLGYMVSRRGIEANPAKIKALLQMNSPKSIKEVQKLAGRIAALNRFLSKSGEKAIPFYKILKNTKHFQWSPECEKAFQEIKGYLGNPPILTSPKEGETPHLYLSVSERALSSVLCALREDNPKPVYYVSHVLQDAETRYSSLEKHVLALVLTARKLKPYFQAHSIKVHTNVPIRQILHKPDLAGRLMKWAIELTEFDVEYLPRKAVKAQVLSDFVLECTTTDSKEMFSSLTHSCPQDYWTIFTDGSSAEGTKGAGIVIKTPEGNKFTYALKYNFPISNNESEYEAFLASLRAAESLKARRLLIKTDSQLLVGHVNGEYEAREENMQKYLSEAQKLFSKFDEVRVEHVPRKENTEADSLSKLKAGMHIDGTWIEPLEQKSIETQQVLCISNSSTDENWMLPIINYIKFGTLPDDPTEAKKLKASASRYVLIEEALFRRAHSWPLLKCVAKDEGNYILREVHEGICGSHIGSRSLTRKVMRTGYFWPTLESDASNLVQSCKNCQLHANVHHLPSSELHSLITPIPFCQWGMDLLGPFPKAAGAREFLVVAIDHFTKWVEAKPLSSITAKKMKEFFFEEIIARFGIPKVLITDNGKQFEGKEFQDFCSELHIDHRFTSVGYPQTNGLTEVTNRTILNGLRKRLSGLKTKWVEELPSVLWSYRTTPNARTNESPFSLCFGTDALVPVEIGSPSCRNELFDPETNNDKLVESLVLIEETRDRAARKEAHYRRQLARHYNRRVKPSGLQVGDLVLRKNEVSRIDGTRKLDPNWEGPYIISRNNGNGSYRLMDSEGRAIARSWNALNLRKFFP